MSDAPTRADDAIAVAPAPTPAPGDAVAALGLALKALVGDATGLYRSADVPRQWFTSDDVAHDFSDALAVLDVAELMEADALSRALDTADEEVLLQQRAHVHAVRAPWRWPPAPPPRPIVARLEVRRRVRVCLATHAFRETVVRTFANKIPTFKRAKC